MKAWEVGDCLDFISGGGPLASWLLGQMLGNWNPPQPEPNPNPNPPPPPSQNPADLEKIRMGKMAVERSKIRLKFNQSCNDFISASKRSTAVVDPNSVTETLNNIDRSNLFFPLGGSQGHCSRAIAYACPAAVGQTCAGGTPGGSITLCDSFYSKNGTEQVLIILHEVWHLYGANHSGTWTDIIPYLDAVPYSVDLAFACSLPCLDDGYTCVP